VVSTVVSDGNDGAPIVLVLSAILLARLGLMRMVLHCTIAAKHMRLDDGEN
jgi:hypothetical protein